MDISDALKKLNEFFDCLSECGVLTDEEFKTMNKVEDTIYHYVKEKEDDNPRYAKCPHCKNVDLEYKKFVFSDLDKDNAFFFSKGFCPKCHKKFNWAQIYKYSRVGYIDKDNARVPDGKRKIQPSS